MEGKDSQEMLGLGPTDHQAERLSCNIVIRCGFFFLFFFLSTSYSCVCTSRVGWFTLIWESG